MVNQQIYEFFRSAHSSGSGLASKWLRQNSDTDCHFFPEAWENQQLRANYGIPVEEEIIFKRDTSFWSSHDQGIVVTDVTIYVHPDNDDSSGFFYFDWDIISHVNYKDDIFYFYDYDNELMATLHSGMFFKGGDFTESNKANVAKFLTEAASKVAQRVSTVDIIDNLEDEEKYDEALQALGQLPEEAFQDPLINLMYGRIAIKKSFELEEPSEDLFNLANDRLQKARELANEDNWNKVYCYTAYWYGYNYFNVGQDYNARNFFINAMESDIDGMKKDSVKMFDLCEDKLKDIWDNYLTTYEYNDRKFLMPVRDYQIAGCTATGVDTFKMSNIPPCIKFPVGHPVANELYIGHPYKPELYVPYKGHEDVFFVDKIHELSYILQCLGAEEISITAVKGKTVNEIENSNSKLGASADFLIVSGSAEGSNDSRSRQTTQQNIERTLVQRFDPIKKPYVPEGLIWYPEESKWQRLVESRLNGNMLEYSEFVSTYDTSFTSSTEANEIKGSVEYLWNKLDANASSRVEKEFEQKVETQWRVDVKFRSMHDFDNPGASKSNALSANEQSYLETLMDYADGGEISDRERRMLDRMRVSLGISEKRAEELMASIQVPQLTEDEREYVEMYREYAEKGEITEKERRRLEKFASALGIAPDRVKEIEK